MSWDTATIDRTADEATEAALQAYDAARRANLPPVDCYRAAVEAWRRVHPDQSPEYAAKRAVAVVLGAHVKFRIEE